MSEQTFQKFKLAIDSFNDYYTNIEEQEEYKILMSKLEAGEIDERKFEQEFEKVTIDKFKIVPEQFTEDEITEIYNNFAELVSKFDRQLLNLFNTIFVPVIEEKYPQFFLDYWNTHDPQAKEYEFTRIFYFTKHHLTEERIKELLLIYKEDSVIYSIQYLIGDITITNRIIDFIFENNIDVYLTNDTYNSMIAQIPNISFEEKIAYLQRRKIDDKDYGSLFSSVFAILPENYTLSQILDLPIIKEHLKESSDYVNLLRCHKFKNVDDFFEQLSELNLLGKFDNYQIGSILSYQNFGKEEIIKIFSSGKLPYSLTDIIGSKYFYSFNIFNHCSLNEILEILNNKEIFPGEIESSLLVELIRYKRVKDNLDDILNNSLLCKIFCSHFSDFSFDLQESMAFFKLYGVSIDELATKLFQAFNKENFTMALSKYPTLKFTVDQKYERFIKLGNEVPDLMTSFNFAIFSDDIFELGYDFAKLMSMYSSISTYFTMKMEGRRYVSSGVDFSVAFPKIWQTIEKECQEFGLDKKEVLTNILSYNQLNEFDFEGIENADIPKLIYYLQRQIKNTTADLIPRVKNFTDLENYESNLAIMCDKKYKAALTLEEKMNIYFNKYFNISREEALRINNMFVISDDQIPEELRIYINKINAALTAVNIVELDNLYVTEKMFTLKETFILEKKLKHYYSSSLRKGIDENNPLNSPTSEISFNGQTLRIHHPIENFCMLVHSTDAYGKLELLNDNYYDSWNKSSRIRNHGICCSYVAHDNLGIAEVRDVLLGFTNWADDAIPNMAPYDLYTANDDVVIVSARPNKFLTYRELIDNTRHTHNEISLERYQDIPGAKHGKIQPSYIIIFEDMSEELKQKAYKAAIEFGQGEPLPIICLDKKLIAERESQKLDAMIEEFRQTGSLKLLSQIICKHENNRSGYRITNPEFIEGENAFFPSDKIVSLIDETLSHYMSDWKTGKITTEDYWQKSANILEILDDEEEKFAVANETGHRTNNIDLPVREWRSKVMDSLVSALNISVTNRIEIMQSAILSEQRDDELFRNFALVDTSQTANLLEMVQTQGVYGELGKNHDLSHIERVLLFAEILAKKESLSVHERELLLVAAAYHDCGRENDREDTKHGERSAIKIAPLLENFTEEEQSIIKIAVEFHEEDEDFILSNLCVKHNLSQEATEVAKQIANLLKDADALDRTRFRNAATLDPKRLRTSSAKGMVEFAKKLQKMYQDLPTYLIEQKLTDEIHYVNR